MKYFSNQTKLKQILEWIDEISDSMEFQGPSFNAFQSIKHLCLNCNNDDIIVREKVLKTTDGGFIIYIPYEKWDDIDDKLKPYARRKIWGGNRDFAFKSKMSFLGFNVDCFLYDISYESEFNKDNLRLDDVVLNKDNYLALDIILEKPSFKID